MNFIDNSGVFAEMLRITKHLAKNFLMSVPDGRVPAQTNVILKTKSARVFCLTGSPVEWFEVVFWVAVINKKYGSRLGELRCVRLSCNDQITGVQFFISDGRIPISPLEFFDAIFDEVKERQPPTLTTA